MRYYPISIDTKDKKLLVLGAGKACEKKVQAFINTEFTIYVIAEDFSAAFIHWNEKKPDKVKLKEMTIDENFMFFAYDYLIIGTNSETINSAMENRARLLSLPYLRLDKKANSSFIANSVINHGDIVVSISTGGKNPTVARLISSEISDYIKKYDLKKIKILNEIREALIKKNAENISVIIEDLWDKEAITLNKYLEDINEN